MQRSAAYAEACALGKISTHLQAFAYEADAAKAVRICRRNSYPQLFERCLPIGHKAFAAWLIDRWTHSISHHDAKAALPCSNRRSQSGWPTSDDKNVRVFYHFSNSISEQNPGPIAAITPTVPGAGRRCFMVSSKTISTDAEDKFPIFFKLSHEAAS